MKPLYHPDRKPAARRTILNVGGATRGADARAHPPLPKPGQAGRSLETLAVVLVLVWIIGFFSAYTLGGLIHVLPVVAALALFTRAVMARPHG